jgi:pimeloyl-ACP methyl ester carboxylesterase
VKISRQTREIINTVLFLLALVAVVLILVIYPLNRSKVLMARPDLDDYNSDSLPPNDISAWTEAGLVPDTFWVETDGLTTLAGLYLPPGEAVIDSTGDSVVIVRTPADTILGTAILIPAETDSRDSLIWLAQAMLRENIAVIVYDQRASGLSSERYHGEGAYEASDLQTLIAWLELRSRLVPPVTVIGFALGGDAAMLAGLEESRMDRVVAVNPYLTTMRLQDVLKDRHDTYWIPFYRTLMWWWYEIRSSYAAPYRKTEDIKAVKLPTLVMAPPDILQSEEFLRLIEVSDANTLTTAPLTADPRELTEQFLSVVR